MSLQGAIAGPDTPIERIIMSDNLGRMSLLAFCEFTSVSRIMNFYLLYILVVHRSKCFVSASYLVDTYILFLVVWFLYPIVATGDGGAI